MHVSLHAGTKQACSKRQRQIYDDQRALRPVRFHPTEANVVLVNKLTWSKTQDVSSICSSASRFKKQRGLLSSTGHYRSL